jgi:hypothetical protein
MNVSKQFNLCIDIYKMQQIIPHPREGGDPCLEYLKNQNLHLFYVKSH